MSEVSPPDGVLLSSNYPEINRWAKLGKKTGSGVETVHSQHYFVVAHGSGVALTEMSPQGVSEALERNWQQIESRFPGVAIPAQFEMPHLVRVFPDVKTMKKARPILDRVFDSREPNGLFMAKKDGWTSLISPDYTSSASHEANGHGRLTWAMCGFDARGFDRILHSGPVAEGIAMLAEYTANTDGAFKDWLAYNSEESGLDQIRTNLVTDIGRFGTNPDGYGAIGAGAILEAIRLSMQPDAFVGLLKDFIASITEKELTPLPFYLHKYGIDVNKVSDVWIAKFEQATKS